MARYLTSIIIFYSCALIAQKTALCRVDPLDSNSVNIKWYFPELINVNGYNVYRKDSGSDIWQKLNVNPILYKSYRVSEKELAKDKELTSYMDMSSKPENIKGLALLAVLIKSFKSDVFSKYLGIRFDDKTVESGKYYQYKITSINKNNAIDSAISKIVLAGKPTAIDAPKDIQFKSGNKKVSFKWLADPDNYFGVNIYRQTNDSGKITLITKEPILLSKTKNNKGEETYYEDFYVDSKLLPHVDYKYIFEAVDFFGSPSKRSKPILVNIKDLDPPRAPDSIYHKLNGRKVTIQWIKKLKETDLSGFNIYRTINNDTDFVKLNSNPIDKNDSVYVDSVNNFGSYLYAISCVDMDHNEGVSNPYFIEVYDNEAPAKPNKLVILADTGRLYLSWEKNTEKDLKGYLVYRTINKDNADTYVKITPRPISDTFFEEKLMKNIKNNFLYKVVAVDESLNRSPYSDFAFARMPDVISPQTPLLKKVRLDEKSHVILEWIQNVEEDLIGYSVYRREFSDCTSVYSKINNKVLHKQSNKFTDRNTEKGKSYQYYIVAIDSSGNVSQSSNSIKFKIKESKQIEAIEINQFTAKYIPKRNEVKLEWKLKNEVNLKTCIVFKKMVTELILSPLNTSREDNGASDNEISKGLTYTYQLRVYNKNGDVFRSENINVTIP